MRAENSTIGFVAKPPGQAGDELGVQRLDGQAWDGQKVQCAVAWPEEMQQPKIEVSPGTLLSLTPVKQHWNEKRVAQDSLEEREHLQVKVHALAVLLATQAK